MATNVDAKLLKQTKFPSEFSQKVDMKKVNVEVMKKWIAGKISEILGSEDDVVIELCFNLLEGSRFPNIKVLQIQLTGFLDRDTPKFCKELWTLCLSAQSNPQGVPKELLEAKKLELIQEKVPGNEQSEAEAADEEIETVMITTGVIARSQDLRPHGAGSHRTEMTTVDLLDVITWTHTSLVIETGGGTKVVPAHLRHVDHIAGHHPVRYPLHDGTRMRA
ncbi:MAG: hypothetical protein Q9219_000269 [cf. Caloplaca sp. 3 TL-2023]